MIIDENNKINEKNVTFLNEKWHFEDIKGELRKRGSSLSRIARECEVTTSTVSQAIRRPVSKRIEKAIAISIGVDAFEIWPDRYGNESVA